MSKTLEDKVRINKITKEIAQLIESLINKEQFTEIDIDNIYSMLTRIDNLLIEQHLKKAMGYELEQLLIGYQMEKTFASIRRAMMN